MDVYHSVGWLDGFYQNVFLLKKRYLSFFSIYNGKGTVGNFLDNKMDPMVMGGYRLSFGGSDVSD
jgi:hypothetical protein